MIKLERLRDMLISGNQTCVISDGTEYITSRERGVKPLIALIDGGRRLDGFYAADKVVGKAAALLYAYMKIEALYACVLSEKALAVCKAHGIGVEYDVLAKSIINRKGDGICPMETLTENVCEPSIALDMIKLKLQEMA